MTPGRPESVPPIDARSALWEARFASEGFTYGQKPNAFVAVQAARIRPGSRVLELGAGEGRNAVWLAEQGHTVTALDIAEAGLAKAEALAARRGVTLETARVDLAYWTPDRTWDAAVCTFLHLRFSERLRLWRAVQDALRPGGLFIAEWFRPEQRKLGYTSGGPPTVDLLIEPRELAQYFAAGRVIICEPADVTLSEGSYHQGPAAVVRFVFEKAG